MISIIIPTHNRAAEIDLCLESILASTYKDFEIIVVDNVSTDRTAEMMEEKYRDKVKLIKSDKNLMAGGGRNLGAKHATGDYLLFIDSDNIIDVNMIGELVTAMEAVKDAGMIGPLMYYYQEKNRIWWAGADINLWTSHTRYLGHGELDSGQYEKIKSVGHIPNIFMVRRDAWKMVGGIDKDYVMHYEESDLAEKVKRHGFGVYMAPRAKTWHNVPIKMDDSTRAIGGEDLKRVYYTGRNRVLFMRRHGRAIQYIVFLFVFLPIFTIMYEYKFIKLKKYNLAWAYGRGVFDGISTK